MYVLFIKLPLKYSTIKLRSNFTTGCFHNKDSRFQSEMRVRGEGRGKGKDEGERVGVKVWMRVRGEGVMGDG